jgi:hypothetical protein
MLRFILIIPVILLSLTFVKSQPKGVEYNVGIKAAFNTYTSRFNFKEDEELFQQSYKLGYQIGGAFDMPLKEIVHFYTELYYSRKGKKTLVVSSGLNNDATYHFIEMPVLVRLKFNAGKVPSGAMKWHFDFGPTISYWISGKGNLFGDGPDNPYKIVFGEPPVNNSDFTTMYISNANRWQWGLSVGLGLDYPVYKGQTVFIDFRANIGGTNLGQFDSVATLPVLGFNDSMDVRFLEFSLSAAYTWKVDWALTKKGKSTVKKRKKS